MPQAGLQQRGGQPALAAPSLLLPGDARGVGFTPASLPGLVLWLDAGSIAQANNTSVSTWTDQSGQGNHAVQGTVAAQPTYLAAGLNGRPALSFEGVDDYMDAPDAPSLDVAAVSVFLVVQPSAVATAVLLAKLQAATWVAPFASYAVRIFGGAANGFVSGATAPLSFGAMVGGTRYVISYVCGIGSVEVGALNGVVTTATVPNASASAAFPLRLGANGSLAQFFAGAMAQAVVYNRALSTAERHAVEGYLSARYGIPVVQS